MIFKDRYDAGRQLVPRLLAYKAKEDTVVLGLVRGGVVVAYEVAQGLSLPLNIIVVRKVGAPGNEELALGAITETGEGLFNDHLISMLGVSADYLKNEVARQKKIAQGRLDLYRSSCKAVDLKGKTVILVDDGLATGVSMRVAIKSVHTQGAKKVVMAVPVAAPDSLKRISKEVDEVVCLSSPVFFEAVGFFFKDFSQIEDDEIIRLLAKA